MICVLKGKEQFRVVSPIYRQNILAGAVEGIGKTESPINFFDPKLATSGATKVVPMNDVTLTTGDCIYVPAYYYIQT